MKTLFNDSQHCFRDKWNLENGYDVDVVSLDFAKVFDKIEHAILLTKLESLIINGKLR